MADTDKKTTAFLDAADRLEEWAESLPRWSSDGQEPWYVFVDRRYEAEVSIIERLRRAPNCRLKTCPVRAQVDLTLGGISVSTDQGLAAACREWPGGPERNWFAEAIEGSRRTTSAPTGQRARQSRSRHRGVRWLL